MKDCKYPQCWRWTFWHCWQTNCSDTWVCRLFSYTENLLLLLKYICKKQKRRNSITLLQHQWGVFVWSM